MERDMIADFKAYIESRSDQFPAELEELILFGSYARGEPTIYSDLDVAVVTKTTTPRSCRAIVRAVLEEFDDIEIGIFCTNYKELETDDIKNTNYYIKKEGIQLWRKTDTSI